MCNTKKGQLPTPPVTHFQLQEGGKRTERIWIERLGTIIPDPNPPSTQQETRSNPPIYWHNPNVTQHRNTRISSLRKMEIQTELPAQGRLWGHG